MSENTCSENLSFEITKSLPSNAPTRDNMKTDTYSQFSNANGIKYSHLTGPFYATEWYSCIFPGQKA